MRKLRQSSDEQTTNNKQTNKQTNLTTLFSLPAAAAPVEKREKRRYARTTYSYVADNEDELSLDVGDIVEVLGEEEDGWWSGALKGKKGVFPNNFVEEITEEEAMPAKKKEEPPAPKPEGRH